MKHLKLAVIALFTLATIGSANAQNEDNPWAVGFGVNAVDFYNSGNFNTQWKDFLGQKDWNLIPSISRITVGRYLDNGFSLQLQGSLNDITTIDTKSVNTDGIDDVDFFYYSVGAAVKYDVNKIFGETGWWDPYLLVGGDFVSMDDTNTAMLTAGFGFNVWFNDNLGLNFETSAKSDFVDDIAPHTQSSLGLVFQFGGKDTDGDGVYDNKDACPDTPGLKELDGCPDADGDGIRDEDDACPNDAGTAEMNGCPDSDGDGIADKDDLCPNEVGTAANKGCPDTDGDGVLDKDDKCPTVAGPASNDGCPIVDRDGDGVLDKDDKCPDKAGLASNDGCPRSEMDIILDDYAKTVLFDTDKATFKSGVTDRLDEVATEMAKFPTANFLIEGHADSRGGSPMNLRLSDRRANAIKAYLVSKGVDANNLKILAKGETDPTATNATRDGRAQNRRVRITAINVE